MVVGKYSNILSLFAPPEVRGKITHIRKSMLESVLGNKSSIQPKPEIQEASSSLELITKGATVPFDIAQYNRGISQDLISNDRAELDVAQEDVVDDSEEPEEEEYDEGP